MMKNNFRKGFFMKKNIGVLWIGGDRRQLVAENSLYELGWNTSVCLNGEKSLAKGKQYENWQLALQENKVLIFPLPMAKDRIYLNLSPNKILLSDIIRHIQPDSLVLGGNISPEVCDMLNKKGIRFIDYYGDELQIRNALPTAEGAIGIAICEMPVMLSGARALVVGYGRIGKILALKLQLLGATVTVAARKPTDIALAKANGHETISIQEGIAQTRFYGFDVIFNTVPVRLFGGEILSILDKEALFIDLASFPYGIDPEAASKYAIRVIRAQSLPGKYSPISAGKILAETVVRILTKEDTTP